MKAILLAAGRGTRISSQIGDVPKSTLPIDGVPLIRITAKKMIDRGIEPIVCVGYQQQAVRKALEGLDVRFYYNPFYDITNSCVSLWFARKELDEDTLIANADVYLEDEILDALIADERQTVMLVDYTRADTGDYFFNTRNGCIQAYGKELRREERNCEYVGLAKIRKSFLSAFVNRLEKLVDAQQHHLWWENTLYSFIDQIDIEVLDVDGHFWSEIDYLEDYEKILEFAEAAESNLFLKRMI